MAEPRPPRVFVAAPPAADAPLSAAVSHHLVRVLRARAGDPVELFDGAGKVWAGRLLADNPNACLLAADDLIADTPRTDAPIHLALSVLKGGAMDRVLRQATELGVDVLTPLFASRSQQARAVAQARSEHWRRVLISAAGQCRRAWLPECRPAQTLDALLTDLDAESCLLLEPQAPALPQALPRRATTLLIGPEGGWSPAERSLAEQRGVRAFSLGALVLRAETAPLAALAALRHGWGWR